MTQLTVFVAVGTGVTLLAALLLSLRFEFHGRRPGVIFVRRWVQTSTHDSCIVLALLCAVAAVCFASIGANEKSEVGGSSISAPSSEATDEGASDPLDALRAYAGKIGSEPSSGAQQTATSAALPDVNTMIEKLVSRLQSEPNDAKGWKMLGWSYLNTDRAEDAVQAYETALKLEPDDGEAKQGLEAAKSAQTSAVQNMPSAKASPSNPGNGEKAENLTETQRDSMIRGMVDRLASRLEASPNDEEGWSQLMRSRMTLGEQDAAKAALKKALESFAGDAAAQARLNTAARDLGIATD